MSAEIIQYPASQRPQPERRSTFPLKKRHVFYVPGYDGRGVRTYRRLFREGCESLESIYGIETELGKAQRQSGRGSFVWKAKATSEDWKVETTYEFFEWDDFVRRDLGQSAWSKVSRGLRAYRHFIFAGVATKLFRDTWQFAVFTLYALILLTLFAAAGTVMGTAIGLGLTRIGAPWAVGLAAGIGVAAGVAWLLFAYLGRSLYVDYLLVDTTATLEYAQRMRPDWEARIDQFAASIVEAAANEDVDEILVVGHSSGTFLAIDIVDRAMRLDPRLGLIGPRLALLTLGSVTPIVSHVPSAEWFREAMARLAVSERLTWLEYQARKDVLSVYRSDPIASSGIRIPDGQRVNPTIVPVQLRSMLTSSSYKALQGNYFAIHFLFVSAAECACHFDYHMIAMGPVPLALRVRYGEDAFAAILPERQASAWARLARTAHEV